MEGRENKKIMRFDGNPYSIGLAQESNAVEITSLYERVWDEYSDIFPHELVVARQPSADQMKNWMRRDTYFVAKEGRRIVGVTGCSLKHGTCLLIHMVVDKGHRERGIGSALTERVSPNCAKITDTTTRATTHLMILFRV